MCRVIFGKKFYMSAFLFGLRQIIHSHVYIYLQYVSFYSTVVFNFSEHLCKCALYVTHTVLPDKWTTEVFATFKLPMGSLHAFTECQVVKVVSPDCNRDWLVFLWLGAEGKNISNIKKNKNKIKKKELLCCFYKNAQIKRKKEVREIVIAVDSS